MTNDNNKINLQSSGFCRFKVPRSENKRKLKKINKYLDLAREQKKAMEH